MPTFLNNLVTVSGGFQAAVNLKANINDDLKVSGYIPTHIASEILNDLASNFHTTSARRSRLITGTYGTGKSHMALVIARIFRDGVEHPALLPVMEKLKKWPLVAENLTKERSFRKGKYLLVNLLGDEGDFKDTLLRELDKALVNERLTNIFPDTAFAAAGRRIDEIRQNYPNHYADLETVVTDHGFVSIDALELQLKNKLKSSYDGFLKIHEELFAGAKFDKNHNMKPEEVYKEVSRRLVEENGYAGIAVIWDEFGRYLQRIVEEPHGKEGEAIQNFADGCCNLQGDAQVHLYLLSHSTLMEFAIEAAIKRHTSVSSSDKDEWGKIEARFAPFPVTTSSHEIFNLIDNIIVQNEDSQSWKDFVSVSNDYFDQETDQAKSYTIFPELNRNDIHTVVTLGCYPLHPMAAFCLPLISQRVGQDNRTLFTFLSNAGAGTLGPFLDSTEIPNAGSPPPFFTTDLLWDFFAIDMEKKPKYKRIFSRFTQADIRIDPDDLLGRRIIKVVAMLQILSNNRAPVKEDIIGYCLASTLSDRPLLKEKLKSLCNKTDPNREPVLKQALDGVYSFTGEISSGLTTELEKAVESRKISPIGHLRTMLKGISDIDDYIVAARYGLDYAIDRKLTIEFVSVEELGSPSKWFNNLGNGDFLDGYALVVLCEDTSEIETARTLIKNKLNNPQILIALPITGIKLSSLLRYHEAISYLGTTNQAMYGKGGLLFDEWEEYYRDYNDHILREIKTLIEPDNKKLEWIMNGEIQANIRIKSQLSELASKMMVAVFKQTPKIVHSALVSEEGKDSQKTFRQNVVDMVLHKDGPNLLSSETYPAKKSIIDSFYIRFKILKNKQNLPEISEPNSPEMQAVWKVIEDGIEKAKNTYGTPISMTEIVNVLRKPPFGLRTRSIPVLLAAVFRKDNLLGNISLIEGTKRAEKINGEMIDKAVFSAATVKLHYEAFGQVQRAILYGVADTFDLDTSKENDKGELVTEIHEKIKTWWFGLPQYSQTTYQINRQVALVVRDKILKQLLDDSCDVYQVLMKDLAEELLKRNEGTRISEQMVANNFKRWKNEIENAVTARLIPSIKLGVCEVFGGVAGQQWGEAVSTWWANLTQEKHEVRIPGGPNDLAKMCADNANGKLYDDEILFALAKSFTGMKLQDWRDFTLDQFKGSLGGAKRTIELYEKPEPPRQPDPDIKTDNNSEPDKNQPLPIPGKAVITINTEEGAVTRTFVSVKEISEAGITFKNMLSGIINGMGRPLSSGECETILLEVIKEYLK